MADDAKVNDDDVKVIVPDETKAKYPDLVEMILASKSMNNQERNYWLQVLPVMTDPQVQELRDILVNEKTKLEEIEKKYAKKPEAKEITADEILALDLQKKKARAERQRKEQLAMEKENPEDILAALGL